MASSETEASPPSRRRPPQAHPRSRSRLDDAPLYRAPPHKSQPVRLQLDKHAELQYFLEYLAGIPPKTGKAAEAVGGITVNHL